MSSENRGNHTGRLGPNIGKRECVLEGYRYSPEGGLPSPWRGVLLAKVLKTFILSHDKKEQVKA